MNTSTRNRIRCGICREYGHNRRTCPLARQTSVQSGAQTSVQSGAQIDSDLQLAIELDKQYVNKLCKINNRSEYDIYVYWINDAEKIHYGNKSVSDIRYIHYLEHDKQIEILAKYGDQFMVSKTYFGKKNNFYKIILDDILKIIHITKDKETIEIMDNKSEIMKWKVAALKSKQLLQDIEKFGKGHSDTIDSLLDCVQDIAFPQITEQDKEHAGVPSILTNVTTMSGIDPPEA